ncbi:MAG: hypothetical protein IKG14_01190 [Clostridia bacterium]|nr:hypothetical protein [Clostridia bacterium]
MFTMPRRGIVNVKMVITEEKILSNIDRVKKLINPNSKRQIIELEDDTYFKDLVESIKTYLIEYPKKKNFPKNIYDSAYDLVEYATNLFEENTKQIERLIKQREYNIKTSAIIKQTLAIVQSGDPEWPRAIADVSGRLPEDVIQALTIVGKSISNPGSQDYQSAMKLLSAKIVNLESNLHIEIDMERVEDRSKALSYIGIEVADALKLIPTPVETAQISNNKVANTVQNTAVVVNTASVGQENQVYQNYYSETRQEVRESLWNKIKNSKFVRAFKYAFRIRLSLSLPEALPSPQDNNNK